MKSLVHIVAIPALLACAAGVSSAATPKEIEDAKKKGCDALRATYARGAGVIAGGGGGNGYGIGPACLAGLAMLEGGVPVGDPAVKAVTEAIRGSAYTQTKTYQIALCLIYLDRYGDPKDVPLIQALACRLIVGQSTLGGWGYECIFAVSQNDEQFLKAIKPEKAGGPPRMHPDVDRYFQALVAARAQGQAGRGNLLDDNSNTQFAVIGIWMSRKYGAPVEPTLEAVEQRFMISQSPQTANWPYTGTMKAGPYGSSPSMYCAGLIGMATAVARREERRQKAEAPKQEPPKKEGAPGSPDDPLFNTPAKKPAEPKKPAHRPPDARDLVVQAAFKGLGLVIAESAQAGGGGLTLKDGGMHGQHDLYFFWSLERTCVIFGIEKLGGVDWYEAGAHSLVISQNQNGTWGGGGNGGSSYGADVNTSFAVLFLCRSNLVRDLSGKVQKDTNTEMRVGGGPGSADVRPGAPTASGASNTPMPLAPPFPEASGNEAVTMAAALVRASDKDWPVLLKKLRDSKGGAYTEALVTAVTRLEGDRLKEARQALADRLTRMTADTLRGMAKAEEAELRRGAVLAMAMKGDMGHVPDLIAAIIDDEEIVVRAAKAGLKALTKQDFGPVNNASIGEKKIAAEAWREWWAKQKK